MKLMLKKTRREVEEVKKDILIIYVAGILILSIMIIFLFFSGALIKQIVGNMDLDNEIYCEKEKSTESIIFDPGYGTVIYDENIQLNDLKCEDGIMVMEGVISGYDLFLTNPSDDLQKTCLITKYKTKCYLSKTNQEIQVVE